MSFDPAYGENLTRDAEAGAALTREAEEDRRADLAQRPDRASMESSEREPGASSVKAGERG